MMQLKIISSFAAFLMTISLFAVPGHPGYITITQPDGTSFQAMIRGDEFMKIVTTADGCAIIKDGDGVWKYARYDAAEGKVSSGYTVGRPGVPAFVISSSRNIPYEALSQASAIKRMAVRQIAASQPNLCRRLEANNGPATKADKKIVHGVILLAQFTDLKFTYSRDYFVNLIKQEGYSYNGATGCALDYYREQLGSDYEFDFEIGPVVTLSNKMSYYGGNDQDDNDKNAVEAVIEACKLSDSAIDYSLLDNDDDGYVDNVFVFVAGKDEAEGGGDDCIWSHQWYVKSGAGKTVVLDGKTIDSYAISTELGLKGNRYVFTAIGTFCHEFGHVLGMMDMYDTDYEGSGGTSKALYGSTGLMDSGCYNNDSNTPPNLNAVDLYTIGIGLRESLYNGTYSLEPINKNHRYLCMETDVPGEVYLFECRNNSGWDKQIGGSGLGIYHVDISSNSAGKSETYGISMTAELRWMYNEVNCRPDHECAKMIPGKNGATSASQVFWPYGTNTSFSPTTSPAFSFWSGTESNYILTGIEKSGENVLFTVSGAVTIPDVEVSNTEIYQDAAIIQWASSDDSFTGKGIISWSTSSGAEGSSNTREVEAYAPGKYACVISGLSPRTAYKVTVCLSQDGIKGKPVAANFTTKSYAEGSRPYIHLGYATGRNTDGSFSKGARIALRTNNTIDAKTVWWFWNDTQINVAADGYYTLSESGTLKCIVVANDGSYTYIVKEITVK